MQPGDSITGINGQSLFIFQDISAELARSRNSTIILDFTRHGQPMSAQVSLGDDGKLGVSVMPFTAFLPVEHVRYTFWQSIPAGVQFGWETLASYVKQFRLVFTKEGAQSLGGFASIGRAVPHSVGLDDFLVHDGLPLHHSRLHEHPAHPGPGRRPHGVPAL